MMASKRNVRRKQCAGKRVWPNAAEAQKFAVQGMMAYRCGFCSGWHVGHPPARIRQAMAARRRNERD